MHLCGSMWHRSSSNAMFQIQIEFKNTYESLNKTRDSSLINLLDIEHADFAIIVGHARLCVVQNISISMRNEKTTVIILFEQSCPITLVATMI